jgi:predicted secreted hydrolase
MWWLALLACSGSEETDAAIDLCDVTAAGQVSLPADDAIHTEPVEWWYWTGHLEAADGRRFGFEQTFFAMQIGDAYVATSGHYALTDLDDQQFYFDITYVDGVPSATPNSFDLSDGNGWARGGDGEEHLHGVIGERSWDLDLVSTESPVLQHGDGYHDYAVGGYTWYYSRQRIDVSGTLNLPEGAVSVTGTAWFDHQWGNLIAAADAGWDWFAIQLDDGREIMLFLQRDGAGVIGGTLREADCSTREIDPAELTVTATGSWTSETTGCTYPHGWDVQIGDLHLTVTPRMAAQELHNDFKTYWEGASSVSGDATGQAYVELAGYCD